MITLICGEEKKKFSVQQAESILYIQNQMRLKGWELPDNSPYKYENNALVKRGNRATCKEEAEEGSAGQSD